MRLTDCTDTLVGIAKNYCPECFKDASSETFNVLVSDSGQYLEELLDLSHLRDTDCTDEVWSICDQAITRAKNKLEADIQVEIANQGSKMRQGWSNYIGKTSNTRKNITFSDYRGVYVRPKVYGSKLVISKIAVWSDTTGTEDFYLLRSDEDDPVSTFTLNTTAGTWQENVLSSNLELTFDRSDDTDLTYHIVRATSANTVNNDDCGCGSPRWIEWATVGESRVEDVNDKDTYSTHGSFNSKSGIANGVRIHLSTVCDMEMCANLNDPGFKNVAARAILLNAAVDLKTNPNLNRKVTPTSILDRDSEQIMVNNFIAEYGEKVSLLAALHQADGECMVCDDNQRRIKSLL